jgi:hypothetical protein
MGASGTVVRAGARRRWAVVLAVVAVLCAVPAVLAAWPVRAADVSPAALRDRIAASAARPHHGFAQSTGLLGLPTLPNFAQVTALLSTTTRMRTWYAAPDRWRVDVIAGGTERDVYQTPGEQYVWDYAENQLTRIVGDQPVRLPVAADLTPPELARRLVALGAGDRLEPLADRRVAGVAAAGLRIVPAAPGTTVAHADVWADPVTGLPLQVEVTARGGARPVFVTRFLEVTPGAPDPGVLTPPEPRPGMGSTVTASPDLIGALNRRWNSGALPDRLAGQPRRDALDGSAAVGAYGAGLARFVVLSVPRRFGAEAYDRVATFGRRLEVPGGEAALLGTGLLTVLVVRGERTWLAAGLVEPAVLERAAADLAGSAA